MPSVLNRLTRFALPLTLAVLMLPLASLAGPPRQASAQQTIEVVQLGLTNNYPNFPELLALFAQSEPNIKIVQAPNSGGSGSTVAQLKAQGANTDVSLVFFGQALGPDLRDADLLQPSQPAGADMLRPTDKDPNGLFYSWALWTPAFIYNLDQLPNPPKSYADLLTADGRLSYDNPATSASGLIFMVGAILANGGTIENPEPGFEYMKQLRDRITTHPASGGESLSLVQKGEVGLVVHYSEANLYNKFFQNAPIGVVVPKEGMPLSALSVGVSKYAPQPEAAKKFVDFLLTPPAQELLAKGYFRPARTDIALPDNVKAALPENYEAGYPFDWDSILPYKQAWIERWINEIK